MPAQVRILLSTCFDFWSSCSNFNRRANMSFRQYLSSTNGLNPISLDITPALYVMPLSSSLASPMAFSTSHQNPSFLKPHHSLLTKPSIATTPTPSTYVPVRCGGPRSHRGPLVKGRILSIEAIQAVQTLKRLHRTNPTNLSDLVSKTLARLIKSDLMATLKEFLRQDQCALALLVFSTVRSEYKADLSLYAEMVQALAKNGMTDDLDRLILDLQAEGGIDCEDKGLINLIKAVIGAERRESTVRLYDLMKRSGWGSSFEADEYVAKVLSNGLKSLGEEGLSLEVENEYKRAFARFSRVKFERSLVQ